MSPHLVLKDKTLMERYFELCEETPFLDEALKQNTQPTSKNPMPECMEFFICLFHFYQAELHI